MPPPPILFFMGEDYIMSEYTKDISKMSVDLGSLGSDNEDQFQLMFEADDQFPIFFNIKDDFYVGMLGRIIYDFALSHIGDFTSSNLTNKDEFMMTIDIMKFKSYILPNEMAKYREIFFILTSFPMMLEFEKANKPICIAISTEFTGKAVNFTWINNTEIRIDVSLK